MRKLLANALRKGFAQELKIAFPQFELEKIARDDAPPGSKVFSWDCTDKINFYISLVLHNNDMFTIEVGWSRLKKFPGWELTFVVPPFKEEICLVRLGQLFNQKDRWWILDELPLKPRPGVMEDLMPKPIEEVLPKIDPFINEAIELLKQHAIPFFEKVVKSDA